MTREEFTMAYNIGHRDGKNGEYLPNDYDDMIEQEHCEDCISRQAMLDLIEHYNSDGLGSVFYGYEQGVKFADAVNKLPSVNPQEPKTGRCKDCKYFEYDSVAKVDGVSLIVAHEICNRWGEGCKTKEDGYCFLFDPQESEG